MSNKKKKLFLIDAFALIYKAHFAFIRNPRMNSKGNNTSAIFGFVNSLIEILEKEKPTHIAVAFDSYEVTERQVIYTEYKANRDKQPEDITASIPIIKSIIEAFKIPILEVPGYEADDIVATITKKVPAEDFDIFMYTPDKDFAQLVTDNVFLYKPARKKKPSEIWDVEKVKKEFGIKRVNQVVEIQGLTGDAVDNIPGIPGIGPVAAKKLIAEFDNIENLLKNTDKLKGKQKEYVENNGDKAILSKQLASLLTDAPVDFDENNCKIKEWDKDTLETLFAELEFKNLGKRILGKEPQKKESIKITEDLFAVQYTEEKEKLKTEKDFDKKYINIENDDELEELIKKIIESKKFSFNIEFSNSLIKYTRIRNISFSLKANEAYYYKFSRDEDLVKKSLNKLKPIFENHEIEKISFDLKFTIRVFQKYGIDIKGKLYDNTIAHYIIDSGAKHEYEILSEQYLNYKPIISANLDSSELQNYYCEKADIYLQLFEKLKNEISESNNTELFFNIESPLIKVLAKMENEGVLIDKKALNEYSVLIEKELKELEKGIHKIAGIGFNINSPQQVGEILFTVMKLDPKAKKTKKSKQYSTSEDVLQNLAKKHKIAELLLNYRQLKKLKSTYVDALPEIIDKDTKRIHTTFDQSVTTTGRLSSKNPNLQNIPIRSERGRHIRKAFIPKDENHVLFSADYSQIELRVVAHTSKDKELLNAFQNNIDVHTATAANVFEVEQKDVTPEMRRKAKEVNFGILYGISAWGLAQRLDIPRKEGSEIINQYFEKYPGVKKYIELCIEKAREKEYAETIFYRRRYLKDINSRSAAQRSFDERNAINAPIQGSAADIIKLAMVNIDKVFQDENLKSKMILQVHDELIFDVYKPELEKVKEIVKDKMENVVKLDVPLIIDSGEGGNWLEAH
ncbi:MAG: DNA polymerase I [Bacteroidota bacterium]|nr:DNA polymerase I [Bacteroidota bacterium]